MLNDRPETLEKIHPGEIECVVFNGGSVKGAAHVTAYAALLACGVESNQIKNCLGTSAGAIIACIRASSYTVDEMFDLMTTLNFKQFLDEGGKINTSGKLLKSVDKLQQDKTKFFAVLPVASKTPVMASRIASDTGIYKGEAFRNWLENLISVKTNIPFCTFAELHEKSKSDPMFCDVHIVAFNLNTKRAEILNVYNSPDVIISDAAHASMAISTLFEAHQIRKKQNGERVLYSNDLYNDGGLTNNFKINAFDLQPNGDEIFNRQVIGFKITSAEEVAYLRREAGIPNHPVEPGLKNFLSATAYAARSTERSNYLNSPKDIVRTIPIDNVGVSTLDFDLNNKPEKFNKLLKSGWDATCHYFQMNLEFPERYKILENPLPSPKK